MKKIVFVVICSVSLLESCSKLSNMCGQVVDSNLLQETYEKNRHKEGVTTADTRFCMGGNGKESDYCDINMEVKDVKKTDSNSFSTRCEANLKYTATFSVARYGAEKKKLMDKIISDNNKADADAKNFVISTFEQYNASYSEEDISLGVQKRKQKLEEEKQEAIDYLNKIMPDFSEKKSAFEVNSIKYTVSESNNYTNITIEDISSITTGE
jgi:hypothetical protein